MRLDHRTVPFAPVRFQDVLTARHQEVCLRHHHPSVIEGDERFWSVIPVSRDAVLHAVAGVKAAHQLRTLHTGRLTALLWLFPVWTDDEVLAMLQHPDVRADRMVAAELRLMLDQRSPGFESYVPGPSRATVFEAIDRANRALNKVDLLPPRGTTLVEHLAQRFEAHEDHHTRTFETMVESLASAHALALVKRLRAYGPNERCRRACDHALDRQGRSPVTSAGPSSTAEA